MDTHSSSLSTSVADPKLVRKLVVVGQKVLEGVVYDMGHGLVFDFEVDRATGVPDLDMVINSVFMMGSSYPDRARLCSASVADEDADESITERSGFVYDLGGGMGVSVEVDPTTGKPNIPRLIRSVLKLSLAGAPRGNKQQ